MSRRYSTIMLDPPWDFKTWSDKGQGKSPSQHYDTMTIEEICALPIADYAADDCALFMWITWPGIFEAPKVFETWGFTYSGLAWEWIKYNDQTEKFSFGGGYGTRKNLEPCLLARKGSPRTQNRSRRDMIISPVREHSRKPDIAYERVEALFKGPYCEMFARQRWPGWNVEMSNQPDKFEVNDD